MKPKFTICRLGAQKKAQNVDEIITKSVLQDICKRLTHQEKYDIDWVEERINGKMFTFETDNTKYYITYTLNRVGGRNSYLQSVPTAFGIFINDALYNTKKSLFCLYFTHHNGNNQTRYHQFIYRLLKSIGVCFINSDEELKGLNVQPYDNVKDLISDREFNTIHNNYNQSSYITDEGSYYHVYGKTFGANQKETTMLCLALCGISDKPIRLFQISDNDSKYLSDTDIDAIKTYATKFSKVGIEILDDTYEFEDDNEQVPIKTDPQSSLRSPRFILNLLEKTGGHKSCSLCQCEIESIIQGAHIYPVQAIKQQTDLSFEERLKMATDKNNGIWLCENHHKLFDRGLIRFENGKLKIMPKLNDNDKEFVNTISTIQAIDQNYFTSKMAEYFKKRDDFYRSEKYY
jgi:hypothetical protein